MSNVKYVHTHKKKREQWQNFLEQEKRNKEAEKFLNLVQKQNSFYFQL